jgi:hypothetical protein
VRADAWRKQSESEYKGNVALGYLREMGPICSNLDMPHPLECVRSVLRSPNLKSSSQLLEQLLGVDLPNSIVSFLLKHERSLGELLKSAENCFLGVNCEVRR